MKAKPKIQPEGHLFGKLDLVRKIVVLTCKVTSLFAEDDTYRIYIYIYVIHTIYNIHI